MKISRHILLLFCLFFTSFSFSAERNDHLTSLIEEFLTHHEIEIAEKGFRSEFKIGRIDPRLALRACSIHPSFSFNRQPMQQNNVTVLAECLGNKPWKLYISVKYNIFGPVIVASGTIPRGTIISNFNIETKEEIINKGRKISFTNASEIIGMIAKRTIRNNTTITASQLKPPRLIKRGDNVIITAANSAISVRMNGTALADGTLGAQISIRNNQSKRIIKGMVTQPGHVVITL